MRALLAMFLLTILTAPVFAMPCDTGYVCKSASGKYQIDIRRCRYDNRLGPATLKLNGSAAAGVKLDDAWWDGDRFLAFQLDFPSSGDHERMLSIEVKKHTMSGTLKDEKRNDNPAPWKVSHRERIHCAVQD